MRVKIMSLILSVAVLFWLLWHSNLSEIFDIILNVHFGYLILSFLLFIPTIFISAWRWKYILSGYYSLKFSESVKLVLAGSTLNLVLPSKAGDLIKAFFVKLEKKDVHLSHAYVLSSAVYEKACDLIGLTVCLWFGLLWNRPSHYLLDIILPMSYLVGILFFLMHFDFGIRSKGFQFINRVQLYAQGIRKKPFKFCVVLSVSILQWFVHLLQFFLFFKMFHLNIDFFTVLSNLPLVIYVGLIPIALGGIGTRDLAIVTLFAGMISYESCLAIGLMGTVRYLVPGLIGLFFAPKYMSQLGRFWGKKVFRVRVCE